MLPFAEAEGHQRGMEGLTDILPAFVMRCDYCKDTLAFEKWYKYNGHRICPACLEKRKPYAVYHPTYGNECPHEAEDWTGMDDFRKAHPGEDWRYERFGDDYSDMYLRDIGVTADVIRGTGWVVYLPCTVREAFDKGIL